jgi:lycopene cyclase-like protein
VRDAVVVVGDGPAGTALAAACAGAGLAVTLLSPDPERAWHNTYGVWEDELPDQLRSAVAHRYAEPQVAFDAPFAGPGTRSLSRAYVVLDNTTLRDALLAEVRSGGRIVQGSAARAEADPDGTLVHTTDGRTLPAGVVVDATGHRPALAAAGTGRPPAWQVAAGIVARIDPSPVPAGGMWLMDWRAGPLIGEPDAPTVPTFLYAMDLGDGTVFVEETSLAARPAQAVTTLRRRLDRRLAAGGARVGTVHATEAVVFPMGGPLPPRRQRVVPYGAAAGMVHPATGYQVATALRRAPVVAAAVAQALAATDAEPAAVSAAAWDAVWPPDLVRQRALHRAGLEVLLRLGTADTQAFFAAFFALPEADWRAYLSGARCSRDLARVMVAVLRRLPPRLQARVALGTAAADPLALARGVLRA